ncbi:Os07g0138500 [Oryza sativa Japonica Group]|uniref:Os07g0138500 protein n=1 Tax=Oryza sativa subsp. japonica TaxID=39947 RepID=A0A0P0X2B7_ORYSJ|nr:Os07g0138500 [Oryza sativa Japonica Group]
MSNPNFPRFPVPGHGREPQPGGATSSSSPGSRFNGLNSGAAPFVPRMVEGAGLAGRMMFGSGAAAGTGATTRSLALAAAVPRGATSVLAGPTAAADFAPSSRDTVYVPVNHDVPLLPIGHHVNLGSASAAGDAMISSSGAPAGAHQYMTNPYAGDAMINSPPSLSLVLTRTWDWLEWLHDTMAEEQQPLLPVQFKSHRLAPSTDMADPNGHHRRLPAGSRLVRRQPVRWRFLLAATTPCFRRVELCSREHAAAAAAAFDDALRQQPRRCRYRRGRRGSTAAAATPSISIGRGVCVSSYDAGDTNYWSR